MITIIVNLVAHFIFYCVLSVFGMEPSLIGPYWNIGPYRTLLLLSYPDWVEGGWGAASWMGSSALAGYIGLFPIHMFVFWNLKFLSQSMVCRDFLLEGICLTFFGRRYLLFFYCLNAFPYAFACTFSFSISSVVDKFQSCRHARTIKKSD